jgi:hypothetical protein
VRKTGAGAEAIFRSTACAAGGFRCIRDFPRQPLPAAGRLFHLPGEEPLCTLKKNPGDWPPFCLNANSWLLPFPAELTAVSC